MVLRRRASRARAPLVVITIVIINDRYDDKFVVVRCNNTGDPKKGTSMH